MPAARAFTSVSHPQVGAEFDGSRPERARLGSVDQIGHFGYDGAGQHDRFGIVSRSYLRVDESHRLADAENLPVAGCLSARRGRRVGEFGAAQVGCCRTVMNISSPPSEYAFRRATDGILGAPRAGIRPRLCEKPGG